MSPLSSSSQIRYKDITISKKTIFRLIIPNIFRYWIYNQWKCLHILTYITKYFRINKSICLSDSFRNLWSLNKIHKIKSTINHKFQQRSNPCPIILRKLSGLSRTVRVHTKQHKTKKNMINQCFWFFFHLSLSTFILFTFTL